ncbi:hypothetical protein LTR36_002451 [Oleoguttula mirabilis]|uniref:3-phytase n=1 Tax=Oleoguttula mirabilis TaxID=1507867 RepID=A0AAV9JLJ9_9PEZI|nr:hypothetical protein LTR36_002451 [Oleoguttula mirabilis]
MRRVGLGDPGKHDEEVQAMSTKLRPVPSDGTSPAASTLKQKLFFVGQLTLFGIVIVQFIMMYRSFAMAAACGGLVDAGMLRRQSAYSSSTSSLPDYYQTTPEIFPGPTPTGSAAFLAETNPAPFASTAFIPNSPLETQVPIVGNTDNGNIFQLMGQLSHYFPNPDGFGVDEYTFPENASIVQLNMLARHGSRYPTTGSGATKLAAKIQNYTTGVLGDVTFTGNLSFLNSWTYKLGAEILVPVGHQELFDNGVLHQYMYGHLYPNTGTKIVARSTTQDRMTQSAEYFLAGFFGLDWTANATLVLAIENSTGIFNNTLAGYDNCNNSVTYRNTGGTNATNQWASIYLADATTRLNALAPGFNWTVTDSYNAQSLCAYEEVALGYSDFCGLFTYEEWQGYEYSVDINFAGNNAFQSPTGRAVGVGYVEEIIARLEHRVLNESVAQINVTLDNNTATFPIDQTLNFDFSHDTNIMGILTAFGFTQFAPVLPATSLQANRSLIVSHMEPFGARLDMEVIETPAPLNGSRANGASYTEGPPTTYIHFVLNQRTLPLGVSFPACGLRDDGWCELTTFLEVQSASLAESQYDYACNGDYAVVPYGTLTDGAPLTNETFTA